MPTYYYLDADLQQQGPVDAETLRRSVLTPALLVWTEGLKQWTPARDVETLRPYLLPPTPQIATPVVSPPPAPPQDVVPPTAEPPVPPVSAAESPASTVEPSAQSAEPPAPAEESQPSHGLPPVAPPEPPVAPAEAETDEEERPQTNLPLAIVATVLCFPLGIPALLAALRVEERFVAGRYAEARAQSVNARRWAVAAIVVGIVCAALYVAFSLLFSDISVQRSSIYYYY